jgi:hypothetical protein
MAEWVEGKIGGDYGEKLMALAQKVEAQQLDRLKRDGLDCEANRIGSMTRIKIGKKYDKIDVGSSGKLMIERSTGEIFGIRGYGRIHRGHCYGTLDTINEWYWGWYYPVKASLMPESEVEALYI